MPKSIKYSPENSKPKICSVCGAKLPNVFDLDTHIGSQVCELRAEESRLKAQGLRPLLYKPNTHSKGVTYHHSKSGKIWASEWLSLYQELCRLPLKAAPYPIKDRLLETFSRTPPDDVRVFYTAIMLIKGGQRYVELARFLCLTYHRYLPSRHLKYTFQNGTVMPFFRMKDSTLRRVKAVAERTCKGYNTVLPKEAGPSTVAAYHYKGSGTYLDLVAEMWRRGLITESDFRF